MLSGEEKDAVIAGLEQLLNPPALLQEEIITANTFKAANSFNARSFNAEAMPAENAADAAEKTPAEVIETGTYTDYAVFSIDLTTAEEVGTVRVTLDNLSIDTRAGVPENATVTGVTYELYHQHEGVFNLAPVPVTVDENDGIITGFSFETTECSNWALKYNVAYSTVITFDVEITKPEEDTRPSYTFTGIDEVAWLSEIIEASGAVFTEGQYSTTVSDSTLVELAESGKNVSYDGRSIAKEQRLTTLAYFDEVILTMTSKNEKDIVEIVLKNPEPKPEEPEVIETNLSDEESGSSIIISGEVPEGAVFTTAEAAPTEEEQTAVNAKLAEAFGTTDVELAYYDIDLTVGDEEIHNIPATVTLATNITIPTKQGELNIEAAAAEPAADDAYPEVEVPAAEVIYGKIDTLKVLHLTDNGVEALDATYKTEGNVITRVTFKTDRLSTFVVGYTVDFTYVDEQGNEHTWSLPGRGEYPLEVILSALEIEFTGIESAALSEPVVLKELDVDEDGYNALYLTGDINEGYVLYSYAAFDDIYTLTVSADNKTHIITVTDESVNGVDIEFYDLKGTDLDESASVSGYSIWFLTNGSWSDSMPIIPQNGVAQISFQNIDFGTGNEASHVYFGKDGSPEWQRTELGNTFDLGAYSVQPSYTVNDSVIIVKAVKQPVYTYKIEFPNNDDSLTGNYTFYVTDEKDGQNYYYYQTTNSLNNTTLEIKKFFQDHNNQNNNTVSFETGDTVTPYLVSGQYSTMNINNGSPEWNQQTEIKDGDTVGDFMVTVTKTDDSVTYSFRKPEPYHYSIKENKGIAIDFDEDYQNNWYLFSTLYKSSGGVYYYVTPVSLNGVAAVPASGTNDITKYYYADNNNIGNVQIGSKQNASNVTSNVYAPGDRVENYLVHVNSPAVNYQQIVTGDNNGREEFGNGDVADKYTVSVSETNGTALIELTKAQDLCLVTEFLEANNEPSTTVPSDYHLLIKMVRDGSTYYALQSVHTGNPATDYNPIIFKKYENGSLSGSYYYTGNGRETISTQVVTGVSSLTPGVINHTEGTFYNENTVGGNQNRDLTKDLYSSSSVISDGTDSKILKTTFVKQQDNGVDHVIVVKIPKQIQIL